MFSKSTNVRVILINFGLLLLISNVLTNIIPGGSDNQKMRLCGKKLTQALQSVCEGVYQSMGKKSIFEYYADQPQLPYEDSITQTDYNADLNTDYNPIMKKLTFRRIRRGVYDECCRDSCTLRQLKLYCGN